jgi:hypothetical protein
MTRFLFAELFALYPGGSGFGDLIAQAGAGRVLIS